MRILNQDFFDMSANTMEYSPSTCLPGFAGQACSFAGMMILGL
jgi:hypothetical protein